MNRAIAYIRVSTEEQAESGLGLDAQRKAIGAAATRLGLSLAGEHADEGRSGATGLRHRPGLFAAIKAVGRGDVLLVAKRDRLARDMGLAIFIEEQVARRGGRVVSAAGEGSDAAGPMGKLIRTMIDAFAEFERGIISERTKAGLDVKRARGEWAGATPYGFRRVGAVAECVEAKSGRKRTVQRGGRLEECPAEQAVIGQIVELRRAGLSDIRIAAALVAQDIRPRNGRGWHERTIREIRVRLERDGRLAA